MLGGGGAKLLQALHRNTLGNRDFPLLEEGGKGRRAPRGAGFGGCSKVSRREVGSRHGPAKRSPCLSLPVRSGAVGGSRGDLFSQAPCHQELLSCHEMGGNISL